MSPFLNTIADTNYTTVIKLGGYPHIDRVFVEQQKQDGGKKIGFFDKVFALMFSSVGLGKKEEKKEEAMTAQPNPLTKKDLKDQLKAIIELPEKDYKESLLTSDLRKYILEVEKDYLNAMTGYKSHIAPSYREIQPNHFSLSGIFGRNYYAHAYPSYIDFLRTRDVLGFYGKRDMSFFIYPEDDSAVQGMLKKRATQLKAQISEAVGKGITIDTEVEVEYRDVETLRQQLATREERYFESGCYVNLYHNEKEKLDEESKKFEQKIGGYGIRIKPSTQRMDEGIVSTLPLALDELSIARSMVTSSLSGGFPFISSDIIDKQLFPCLSIKLHLPYFSTLGNPCEKSVASS